MHGRLEKLRAEVDDLKFQVGHLTHIMESVAGQVQGLVQSTNAIAKTTTTVDRTGAANATPDRPKATATCTTGTKSESKPKLPQSALHSTAVKRGPRSHPEATSESEGNTPAKSKDVLFSSDVGDSQNIRIAAPVQGTWEYQKPTGRTQYPDNEYDRISYQEFLQRKGEFRGDTGRNPEDLTPRTRGREVYLHSLRQARSVNDYEEQERYLDPYRGSKGSKYDAKKYNVDAALRGMYEGAIADGTDADWRQEAPMVILSRSAPAQYSHVSTRYEGRELHSHPRDGALFVPQEKLMGLAGHQLDIQSAGQEANAHDMKPHVNHESQGRCERNETAAYSDMVVLSPVVYVSRHVTTGIK